MKRRTFLRGVVILGVAVATPVRWAYGALKKKVQPPRISSIGTLFSLTFGGSWPSYAEAY